MFRSLQDFLSTNDAGTPSEVMLQDPIQKSVPAVNPLRLSSNTAPFLLALAFLVDLETALPGVPLSSPRRGVWTQQYPPPFVSFLYSVTCCVFEQGSPKQ